MGWWQPNGPSSTDSGCLLSSCRRKCVLGAPAPTGEPSVPMVSEQGLGFRLPGKPQTSEVPSPLLNPHSFRALLPEGGN